MEKYRRFTDEATGINPFINPLPKLPLLTSLARTVKGSISMVFLVVILPLLFIFGFFAKGICSWILLMVIGGRTFDDNTFCKKIKQNHKMIILSNACNIMDPFYYYFRFNGGVEFIVSRKNGYSKISGWGSLLLRSLFKAQPFYEPDAQGLELSEIIKDRSCIIFYQPIRTNGLGTLRFPQALSEKIYHHAQNNDYGIIVCAIRYLAANSHQPRLSSIRCLFVSMCNPSTTIKCRAAQIENCYRPSQVKQKIQEFLKFTGSKLVQLRLSQIETKPEDYAKFIQFYKQTPK